MATETTTQLRWRRVLRGLYVDNTNTWAISCDGPEYWTQRAIVSWGPSLSGKRLPDYSDTIYSCARTLHEVQSHISSADTPSKWDIAEREFFAANQQPQNGLQCRLESDKI
jgi:hypothetical protein